MSSLRCAVVEPGWHRATRGVRAGSLGVNSLPSDAWRGRPSGAHLSSPGCRCSVQPIVPVNRQIRHIRQRRCASPAVAVATGVAYGIAVTPVDPPLHRGPRRGATESLFSQKITLPAFLLAAGLLAAVVPLELRGQQTPAPPTTADPSTPPATATSPAATSSAAGATDPQLPSAESLQAQIDAVTADNDLNEALQTRLLTRLRATLEQVRNLQENRQRQAAFATAAQTAPQRIAAARQTLAEDPPEPTLPPEATDPLAPLSIQQWQQRTAEAEAELAAARQELQSLEATARQRLVRASALAMLIADAREAVDEAAASSVGPLDGDPQGTLRAARENERLVNLAAARQRLAALVAEQAMIDAEAEWLPLEIEVARRNVQRAEKQWQLWTEALEAQRQFRIQSELAQYRTYLQQAGINLERSLALTLSEQWIELVSSNAAVRKSLARQRSRFDELDATFKQVEAEITRDLESPHGLRSGLGLKLQRMRLRLPSPNELRSDIRAVDESIEQSRQLQTTIDLTLEDIGGEYVIGLVHRPDLRLPLDNGKVDPQEVNLLRRIEADADNHINDLIELKSQLELNRRKVGELRVLIEHNVIWIRDAVPLRVTSLRTAWWTLRWILHPNHLRAAAAALTVAAMQRIDLAIIWVAFALIPWCASPRLRRHVDRLNQAAQTSLEHPLRTSVLALVISLLLAVPASVTLGVLGAAVLHAANHDAFLQALGGSLQIAALAILPMRWLRQMLRFGGVAESQFGLDRETTRPAGVAAGKMIFFAVPFVVLWGLSSSRAVSQGEDTLGRAVFVLAMAALAAILWRALDPRTGVTSKYLREHPEGWTARLRYFWHVFALLPLVLAALSLLGYTYAATLLTARLYWSLWFFIALMVGGGLLTRWVQVRRARRALSEPVAAPSPGPPPVAPSPPTATADAPNGYPAPAEIDAQTLRILRALLWVTILVGVAWLWAPVLPAVRFLERIPLWDTTAIDGTIIPITLAHLVTALPIIFLTWVAARNVPGLVETVLLERLPLDKPARYAITALASYALAIIGIMLTAQTIGLRWEGIQWLVAALGVGLGFGLQEIFANFVSGLILLFEQPIRVGDVVTIGQTTGTV